MKKSQKTNATKRRKSGIFWSLTAGLVVLLLAAGAILFVFEFNKSVSDGGDTGGIHQLSSYEKSEIDLAIQSENEGKVYTCVNNPRYSCFDGTNYSVSYFPTGYHHIAELTNFVPNSSSTIKQIGGSLVHVSSNQLVIKASDGQHFTINFPDKTLENFNTSNAFYNINDPHNIFLIDYTELLDNHSTTIQPYQILGATIGQPY